MAFIVYLALRKKYVKVFFAFSFLINSVFCPLFGQKPLLDSVYHENIKTVLLHRGEDKLAYPVLSLHDNDRLHFSFDELGDDIKNYYYAFIHCDANWVPTNVSESDYMDGTSFNQITDYLFSFNTFHEFIHYELSFPNQDIRFRKPGNYVLKIYEDYNPDQVVLTQRFFVVSPKVEISTEVKVPNMGRLGEKGQKVNFRVKYNTSDILNPYENISVMVMQNGRWDNAIRHMDPLHVRHGELIYEYEERNIFMGGNEFRRFNIKSTRYQTEYIERIEYKKPYFHVYLYPDELKIYDEYFYEEDINGKYFIDVQEGRDSETDADYIRVHFSLNMDAPMVYGDIYLLGALTNWNYSPVGRMEYNFEKKAYEKTLLLKQGFYNYQYVFLPDGKEEAEIGITEGNHYQTENDYRVFIYYRAPNSRYDKLIGYTLFNSEGR